MTGETSQRCRMYLTMFPECMKLQHRSLRPSTQCSSSTTQTAWKAPAVIYAGKFVTSSTSVASNVSRGTEFMPFGMCYNTCPISQLSNILCFVERRSSERLCCALNDLNPLGAADFLALTRYSPHSLFVCFCCSLHTNQRLQFL